jgi:hypothetical protein
MHPQREKKFQWVSMEFHLPLVEVQCPFCQRTVEIDEHMDMMETLWMHEWECGGIAKVA